MEIVAVSAEDAVSRAMSALDAGGLLVLPGDLAYLVVADALDDDAVERLFLATARGADRPLTTLVSGYSDVHHVAYGGSAARALADEHWPGPATLVMKARPWLPQLVAAGRDTVRVSAPRGFAGELARHFGPLAAAGARRQGEPPSLDARAAAAALANEVQLAFDAGALPGGEPPVLTSGEG